MEPEEAAPVRRAAGLPARYGRQRDDLGAGGTDPGRDGGRGAGPRSGSSSCRRPWRRRSSWPVRRWPPRPAATSAWCTSSGCCAKPPSSMLGGIVDKRHRPAATRPRHARRDHQRLATYSLVAHRRGRRGRPPGRRGHRGRPARPPAAARLARPGSRRARLRIMAEPRRPTDRSAAVPDRASARQDAGSTSRASAGIRLPRFDTRRRFGRWAEAIARFMGTARFLVYMTVVILVVDRLERTSRPAAAVRPVHLHVPDPDALLAGLVRGAAHPAGAEPAGRPGPARAWRRTGGGPRLRRRTPSTWPARSPRCASRWARWRPATSSASELNRLSEEVDESISAAGADHAPTPRVPKAIRKEQRRMARREASANPRHTQARKD